VKVYSLNGIWKMKEAGNKNWNEASVPGSVFKDLFDAGLIEDPFYRDNEDKALELSYNDYEYIKIFDISGDLLKYDKILLYCGGLDTLSEIKLNGQLVARTSNMHRCYEFDIKKIIKRESNGIHITFFSPTLYIEKRQKENPLLKRTDDMVMDGFYHLRKAHCMFGWDWGPRIPDSGIWRNIELRFFNDARLRDIYVTQDHKEGRVRLDINISFEIWSDGDFDLRLEVLTPDGNKIFREHKISGDKKHKDVVSLDINDPRLWWPNGYGKQDLYKISVNLIKGEEVLDLKETMIGLRTFKLKQEKDRWGKSFGFEINDVSIFARGANYIIEDSLISRCSYERTRKLIEECVHANFNCIRVWGGGIYPHDYFFELCDRYGIIVWQDFMFSCSIYPSDSEFIRDVELELEDNIKRIRNHPSLCLWCGNNEIEWILDMIERQASAETQVPSKYKLALPMKQVKGMYARLFEDIIPGIVNKYDPGGVYWPSSPSSCGKFDDPNDENRGDVHCWEVWHGLKSFDYYSDHYFRFTSEYGFQSFPGIKTVSGFTLPKDRNIFSYIMEKHQKNESANSKILTYLSGTFRYPKDFRSLLYTSQLLQAEAVKSGAEHWRRNRGRCMGSIYWQLNDCWPGASWSSIDYYGRWKALHYYAARFYAPVLISAVNSRKRSVDIFIVNDSLKEVKGTVEWKLRNRKSDVISEDKVNISVASLTAESCIGLDLKNVVDEDNVKSVYLEFSLNIRGECISSGTMLFVKPKYFDFINPGIKAALEKRKERFIITLVSKAYARSVELNLKNEDCRFSDNYFDLSAGCIKEVELYREGLPEGSSLDDLMSQLEVRSLYDASGYEEPSGSFKY
jgi:beta-mannosidase